MSSRPVPYAESVWPLVAPKLRSDGRLWMLCWLLARNESWLPMGFWDGRPMDLRPWEELAGRGGAGEFNLATLFMAASALVAVDEMLEKKVPPTL